MGTISFPFVETVAPEVSRTFVLPMCSILGLVSITEAAVELFPSEQQVCGNEKHNADT